tara:strand:+ start:31032 stop:32210 length:1179 start_codon:yes stop_codon:yes gene_type:complete
MNVTSDITLLKSLTPALVYDEATIYRTLHSLSMLTANPKCKALYSLKACAFVDVIELIAPHVDGFSCSSPNEVRLVSEIVGSSPLVQLVSPGLSAAFLKSLNAQPNYLTFNSLEQFYRLEHLVDKDTKIGIRINPKTKHVANEKYSPCRIGSKLGVEVSELLSQLANCERLRSRISGLHVHDNCESEDFGQLHGTALTLKPLLELNFGFKWINLGGGYQIESSNDNAIAFHKTVDWLVKDYNLDVIIEPGNGIVRESGRLVTTILDIIETDSSKVAILDTTVNHAPEIFEYDWSPPVLSSTTKGIFKYTLAGCTCLAGDVFGEYSFEEPLTVSSKIVFESLGAYSMMKASMFNGVDLPKQYLLTEDGELVLRKSFSFEDFANICGVTKIAIN